MKVGDLVVYISTPRKSMSTWRHTETKAPGILIEELTPKGTTSRMFSVRWNNGVITDEWTAFLFPYGEG